MIRQGLKIAGALLFVGAIAWSVFTFVTLLAADQQSVADRATLRTELTEEQAARQALTEQVESLGETPVVEPSKKDPASNRYVPVPGPSGPAGNDGKNGKDGKSLPGLPGKPGQTIVGPPGPTGPTGPAGKDGKDGGPGTDGKDGNPGDNGTNGADGRGVTSLSCTGSITPITFTVTYTDGTTQTFSCGSASNAEPEPVS